MVPTMEDRKRDTQSKSQNQHQRKEKRTKRSSPEWSVYQCPMLRDGCECVAYAVTLQKTVLRLSARAFIVVMYVPKHLPTNVPYSNENMTM